MFLLFFESRLLCVHLRIWLLCLKANSRKSGSGTVRSGPEKTRRDGVLIAEVSFG